MFSGVVSNFFELKGKGLFVQLTDVEGLPEKDMIVMFYGELATITEVGRNSTDGQAVSTRSCLTGQPVTPYGSVLLDWPTGRACPPYERGVRLEEVQEL